VLPVSLQRVQARPSGAVRALQVRRQTVYRSSDHLVMDPEESNWPMTMFPQRRQLWVKLELMTFVPWWLVGTYTALSLSRISSRQLSGDVLPLSRLQLPLSRKSLAVRATSFPRTAILTGLDLRLVSEVKLTVDDLQAGTLHILAQVVHADSLPGHQQLLQTLCGHN
jgi:hypothetical protein